VARVIDGGVVPEPAPGRGWIAWEWVEGEDLGSLLLRGETLGAFAVVRLLADLAAGIAHLHARGVVHRDVAPANVIQTPGGRGVLVDFSHAFVGPSAPQSPGILGTPGYLAPEEVRSGGPAVGPAADVYGLGALGYALLLGSPPATGDDLLETLAHATRAPVRPRDLGVEVPPELESVLLDSLSGDPERRPSARQVARALAFADAALGLGDGT
jgi:serine/threonine-protein kinase